MVINVKRLTVHFASSCYGKPEELYSDHAVFSAREVKFIRKRKMATIKGPQIEIKYNPHKLPAEYPKIISLEYSKDFSEMCEIACKLIGEIEPTEHIKSNGVSLEILFENGEKYKFDLNSREHNFLVHQLIMFSFSYMPEFFKETFDDTFYYDQIA